VKASPDRREEALKLVNSTPQEERALPRHAARLNNLAVTYQNEGRYVEADVLYKESLAIWEHTLGAADPLVAQSLSNRASLYRLMREYHEAEAADSTPT